MPAHSIDQVIIAAAAAKEELGALRQSRLMLARAATALLHNISVGSDLTAPHIAANAETAVLVQNLRNAVTAVEREGVEHA